MMKPSLVREGAVGRADIDVGVRLGGARLRLVADGEDRKLLHLQRRDRIEHVDLDELTLAGALAMQKRGERALERGVGGDRIDEVLPGRRRRLAGATGREHRAGHPCSDRSCPGRLTYGPVSP